MRARYSSTLPGERMASMIRRSSYHRSLLSNLLAMPRFLWDSSHRIIDSLLSADDPAPAELCRCYLLAQTLLFPDQTPKWAESWFRETFDPDVYFQGIPWNSVRLGRWRAAPVLVVDATAAVHRRHFIVGVCPGAPGEILPAWAEAVLDPEARSALTDACGAAARRGYLAADQRICCFPLVPPDAGIQIQGRSLGLAAALAMVSAAKGETIHEGIAATGSVSSQGRVGPVGHLDKKTAWAAGWTDGVGGPVRAFLYPAEQTRPHVEKLERLPVSDLDQAWMFACLFTPGREGALMRFSEMLQNPDALVRNIPAVPPDWIRWALKNDRIQPVMADVASDPALFSSLVDGFEPAVKRGDLPAADAVSDLIDSSVVSTVRAHAPLAAFRWCGVNLSLANHHGDIRGAGAWASQGEDLIPLARCASLEAVADFYNHYCVFLHNRYRFCPHPPAHFQSVLELLEEQYAIRKKACPAFPVLGRLYGTLAQHLAFCGPDYLDQVEAVSEKARIALGRQTVPEYRPEWLRQYSYLAYACLDAGETVKAEQALFAYLEVDGWDDVWPRLDGLNRWAHALLARFLADAGDDALRLAYHDRVRVPIARKTGHPWQLWCWNRGRIAGVLGDSDGAEKWFRCGIERCVQSSAGETIFMMALLPLSGLLALGTSWSDGDFPSDADMRSAARRVNERHFRVLTEGSIPFSEILEQVWACPGDLFPFSYR